MHSTGRLIAAFLLSLAGAGLIAYDLLGPHQGWLILGMILMIVGTIVLKKG